jgi:16S rRNA (cytidine1402-2'-O)-methyltransferase
MSDARGGGATPGALHIVATPIGNLADLSPRAIAVLREVSAIIAEDSRVARVLLS